MINMVACAFYILSFCYLTININLILRYDIVHNLDLIPWRLVRPALGFMLKGFGAISSRTITCRLLRISHIRFCSQSLTCIKPYNNISYVTCSN